MPTFDRYKQIKKEQFSINVDEIDNIVRNMKIESDKELHPDEQYVAEFRFWGYEENGPKFELGIYGSREAAARRITHHFIRIGDAFGFDPGTAEEIYRKAMHTRTQYAANDVRDSFRNGAFIYEIKKIM